MKLKYPEGKEPGWAFVFVAIESGTVAEFRRRMKREYAWSKKEVTRFLAGEPRLLPLSDGIDRFFISNAFKHMGARIRFTHTPLEEPAQEA